MNRKLMECYVCFMNGCKNEETLLLTRIQVNNATLYKFSNSLDTPDYWSCPLLYGGLVKRIHQNYLWRLIGGLWQKGNSTRRSQKQLKFIYPQARKLAQHGLDRGLDFSTKFIMQHGLEIEIDFNSSLIYLQIFFDEVERGR